jgi:uncharacterized membrane protein (UPF0182 family)
LLLTLKDIANSKSAARRIKLAEKTSMEALFDKLQQFEFFFKYTTNTDTQRLQHLFWLTLALLPFAKDI